MNPRLNPTALGKNKGKLKGSIQKDAAGPSPAELLARMPKRPLTPEQQLTAIEKVQQQATQRVKLGQQLFEAADAKLKQHQELLSSIQDQQQIIRDQVQDDVAKSLQSYDQWMGTIDENFTKAIRQINERLDQIEMRVDSSRGELESMIEKATALMGQTQGLMAEAFESQQQFAEPPADVIKHAEPTDTVYDVTPTEGDEAFDDFAAMANPYPAGSGSHVPDAAGQAGDQAGAPQDVAAEMQQSVPEDPFCDVDALGVPELAIDTDGLDQDSVLYEAETAPEVFEVDIVPQGEATAPQQDAAAPDGEEDDVFGEVLRRLRKRAEDDGFAAA